MTMYLPSQDEIKIEIDGRGYLILTQIKSSGTEFKIIVSSTNIKAFKNAINSVIKHGYIERDE